MTKFRRLDKEYGAAELAADDPLVEAAKAAGWRVYEEPFNAGVCRRVDGEEGEFELSGSQYSKLLCVYDAEKWEIV